MRTWTRPEGGLFVWTRCAGLDASALLRRGGERGLFIRGRAVPRGRLERDSSVSPTRGSRAGQIDQGWGSWDSWCARGKGKPAPPLEAERADHLMVPEARFRRARCGLKTGLAEMLKGGSSWTSACEQAVIARGGGAVAVMALERVPADIRAQVRSWPHVRPRPRFKRSARSPSRDGQVPHRPLRRGPGAAVAGEWTTSTRARSSPRRRGVPRRQARLQIPSSAAVGTWAKRCPDRRGRGDDPTKGRRGPGTWSRPCATSAPWSPDQGLPASAGRR
jgi:hypothetical protein